jgi:uncharacterized protein
MTASPPPGTSLRARLQAALAEALRGRDLAAASALRSALAALSNAEAVPAGTLESTAVTSPHVAGTTVGVGTAEAGRRSLSPADAEAIVRTEIAERRDAADGYERHGHPGRAGKLRHEADVLTGVLEAGPAAGHG